MAMGRAAPQSGLEFISRARPWVISLAGHAVFVAVLLIFWRQASFSPSRTWRLVSTVDLRSPSSDVIRSAASSLATSALAAKTAQSVSEAPDVNAVAPVGPLTADALQIPYPVEARKLGAEGSVRAEWDIDREGHAQNVTVVESSGFLVLDEAVRNGIQQHSFQVAGGHREARFRFVLTDRRGDR